MYLFFCCYQSSEIFDFIIQILEFSIATRKGIKCIECIMQEEQVGSN